ncbi:beta-galactosidase [Streptomyces sp. 3214.6]|uniref:beta-galactosidase n=1 Tax=Streptomyces sp. 3214.6 TaxID=1882757 RepID=UPI003FA72ACF
MRARYDDDLDTLNHAWGTIFWSQWYYDWDQILPPRATGAVPNPTHRLDWRRCRTQDSGPTRRRVTGLFPAPPSTASAPQLTHLVRPFTLPSRARARPAQSDGGRTRPPPPSRSEPRAPRIRR